MKRYIWFSFVLFIISLIISCTSRSPYSMNIHLDGMYSVHKAKEITTATFEAYRRLRECKELEKNLKAYGKIMRLQKRVIIKLANDVEIAQVRLETKGDFCGFVWGRSSVIYLNPYHFGLNDSCEYVRTIGHEMLHLGGFGHQNEKKCNHFNSLLKSCGFGDKK